jgi:hypothetical protein
MTGNLKVDLITQDPNGEWVLYLVEDAPWPETLTERLSLIQARIFDAFDASVDGHLKNAYPESANAAIRIQVDSPHGAPKEVHDLVVKIREFWQNDPDYKNAVDSSPYINSIRLITGAEMGRFKL